MILNKPFVQKFEKGQDHFKWYNGQSQEELNESAKIHFGHLRQLGKSLGTFQYSVLGRRGEFVFRMKSCPMLMYAFIKIRSKKNGSRYRPDMYIVKSSTTKDDKGMLLIKFPCEYT
jgi:hypothetical protein